MKKLIFLLFPLAIFAQSFLISNIPIPKTYIQNLDPYPCDEKCLQEYIDNDMIFSFLAHVDRKLENKEQDEIRMMQISILNLGSNIISGELRIALLLPYKTIGRYAASTTNSAFSYLITKNRAFELKSYKIENESTQEIQKTITQIEEDGFDYIIAPLTKKGADALVKIDPKMYVFFPTINKNDINSSSPYLFYGGIDYKAQTNMLLKEAVSPLVIFYDKSAIGKKLSLYEEESFKDKSFLDDSTDISTISKNNRVIKYSIPRRTTNLERQLKRNSKINEGSFFLNTPIVKSGMIMSQLTLYDANATNVLSTQINYDPILLSITQYNDRKDMIVANSITEQNNVLIESNALLSNDIIYDWINYTTTVGVDYFFNLLTNDSREYNIDLQDNQMIYKIELLQPSFSRFKKYTSTTSKER
jgi:SRSO17 transposase